MRAMKYQIILFLVVFIMNTSNALEKNSYFIGHAYGSHGNNHVPDKSLINFLIKNPANFILFGGDVTENKNDFKKFNEYFKDTNHLIVRGNHDNNLYVNIPFWRTRKIQGTLIYNLDMSPDMKFELNNLKTLNNFIIAQHYIWYLRLFSEEGNNYSLLDKVILKLKSKKYRKIPIANNMYGSKIMEHDTIAKTDFGKKNTYLAGDCGAFKNNFSYVKTYYKDNIFICSGIGSGWANNVVNLNTLEPIFFNHDGNIVEHRCKIKIGNFDNLIEFCLPKNNKSDELWKKIKNFN